MTDDKKSRIPSIPEDRLDKKSINSSVGSSAEDKKAHAFIKGRVEIKNFQVRLPVGLWEELRQVSFDTGDSLNKLCIYAVEDLIKKRKRKEKSKNT